MNIKTSNGVILPVIKGSVQLPKLNVDLSQMNYNWTSFEFKIKNKDKELLKSISANDFFNVLYDDTHYRIEISDIKWTHNEKSKNNNIIVNCSTLYVKNQDANNTLYVKSENSKNSTYITDL